MCNNIFPHISYFLSRYIFLANPPPPPPRTKATRGLVLRQSCFSRDIWVVSHESVSTLNWKYIWLIVRFLHILYERWCAHAQRTAKTYICNQYVGKKIHRNLMVTTCAVRLPRSKAWKQFWKVCEFIHFSCCHFQQVVCWFALNKWKCVFPF